VRAHAEAAWLLNCVTPLGWLQRMTQFKDKSARQESVSTGLLDYPVLQAADIMLYDAHEVPVGEDQKQHIELTRDIGQRFNHFYEEEFFVIPEAVIPTQGARIMGLDEPTNKMSKSLAGTRGHAIRLLDEPKEIMRSFKRAVTDSGNEIHFSDDPQKAGVNNLLGIYRAVTGKSEVEVLADFSAARGYGDLKKGVAEAVVEMLTPIQARYHALMADPAELDRLLARGAAQARAQAEPKVAAMKEIMGLTLPL
jgi:tryptophanyl-tRNA synthetase